MKQRGGERDLQRGDRRIRSGSGERRNLKFRTSKEEGFQGYSPSPAALPSLSFSPSPVFAIVQRIVHQAVKQNGEKLKSYQKLHL